MKKIIYIVKNLDTLFTGYFTEKEAVDVLEKRRKFLGQEFDGSIEEVILIFSSDDIKNIISENINLAKEIVESEMSSNQETSTC
ncbi:MAG: hypothetical protein RSB50_08305 [Cetobacterium sp.]